MIITPENRTVRMAGPSQRGLGLAFGLGGGWYRVRFDLDLGKLPPGEVPIIPAMERPPTAAAGAASP